jgi:ATP-dependent DNA ligase
MAKGERRKDKSSEVGKVGKGKDRKVRKWEDEGLERHKEGERGPSAVGG